MHAPTGANSLGRPCPRLASSRKAAPSVGEWANPDTLRMLSSWGIAGDGAAPAERGTERPACKRVTPASGQTAGRGSVQIGAAPLPHFFWAERWNLSMDHLIYLLRLFRIAAHRGGW